MSSVEYIYLLQTREFVRTCENVFKIGKTTQENDKRFKSYPKGSILIFQSICKNCDKTEKEIIKQFKNKFIHRKDFGNEYFEGNLDEMIFAFCQITIENSKDMKNLRDITNESHINNSAKNVKKNDNTIDSCYKRLNVDIHDEEVNDEVNVKKEDKDEILIQESLNSSLQECKCELLEVTSPEDFNATFLNETCENVININDFVDSIQVGIEDLEETHRLGFVDGISRIIINNLNKINKPNRPICCINFDKIKFHIKNEDVWNKNDDNNNHKLKSMIQIVAGKNINQIFEWQKINPGYRHELSYQKMLIQVMNGSTIEESNENINKIIKNIAKETIIDVETSMNEDINLFDTSLQQDGVQPQKTQLLPIITQFFEYIYSLYQKDRPLYLNYVKSHNNNESVFVSTKLFDLFKKFEKDCNCISGYNTTSFGLKLKDFCIKDCYNYDLEDAHNCDFDNPKLFIIKRKYNNIHYHINNNLLIKYLESQELINLG
jgi:hypothetical protein